MSGEFWADTARLAVSGAIVAAVAAPVGILAREIVRARREHLFPPVKPWRVPWGGFELILVFFLAAVPDVLRGMQVLDSASGVLALPVQLLILFLVWKSLYPAWSPFREDATGTSEPPRSRPWMLLGAGARVVTVAVAAWALLAPFVLALNMVVTQLFAAFEIQTESHPLTKMGGGVLWERALFLAQVCVAAPLIEEILFRGLLLPWTIGGREWKTGGIHAQRIVPAFTRPLFVMLVAVFYASLGRKAGPIVFAGALVLGMILLWFTVQKHKRHVRAVYATAALFALVHSGVWPSPIPLFVLGLGLGWLAVRTRGVLAPAIVHGLFNAVSAFYVLRSASL